MPAAKKKTFIKKKVPAPVKKTVAKPMVKKSVPKVSEAPVSEPMPTEVVAPPVVATPSAEPVAESTPVAEQTPTVVPGEKVETFSAHTVPWRQKDQPGAQPGQPEPTPSEPEMPTTPVAAVPPPPQPQASVSEPLVVPSQPETAAPVTPAPETSSNWLGAASSPAPATEATTPVQPSPQTNQDNPFSDSAIPPKKSNTFLFFLLFLFFLGLIGSGGFYYYKMQSEAPKPQVPTPEVVDEQASPTPTEASPSSLATYKVQVLNGSGVSGAASKAAASLKDGGFSNISTGNADSSSKTTTVALKDSVTSDAFDAIAKALATSYTASKSAQPLSSSSSFDIVVTLGQK